MTPQHTGPPKGPDPMEQPQNQGADPEPGTRPPPYVVVTWVNEQLRDRIQRNAVALGDILQPKPERLPVRAAEPQLDDFEAEP